MAERSTWTITLDRFTGFAPGYWRSTYPSFGNKDQAGAMQNVDLRNPNSITQGPDILDLTNGTQAGVVSTTARGILRVPVSSGVAYAVGGNLLYQLSATVVTNTPGTWPHTINKPVVTGEDGEDVGHYRGGLLYSYNHSGTQGDIGRYDIAGATFDDVYWTTTLAGTALVGGVPHQIVIAGNDIAYITNGRFIASLDGTSENDQALDFQQNAVAVSAVYDQGLLAIAVNRPNVTGTNHNESAIYYWDMISSSWRLPVVPVPGRIGALYVKDGLMFVWYEDISMTGGYKLGVVSGTTVREITQFTGSLPLFYQVFEDQGYLCWLTTNQVWAWGAAGPQLPTGLMQLADPGYATVGGAARPFGAPIIGSTDGGGNFHLARLPATGTYNTACTYSSLMFRPSKANAVAEIERITAISEQMGAGASCAVTLRYDGGKTTRALTAIAPGTANRTRHVIFRGKQQVEDFRLDLDWSGGSTTNAAAIKAFIVEGSFVENR